MVSTLAGTAYRSNQIHINMCVDFTSMQARKSVDDNSSYSLMVFIGELARCLIDFALLFSTLTMHRCVRNGMISPVLSFSCQYIFHM